MLKYWRRLIVALDLEDKRKIREIVNSLSSRRVKFKVGSIAFTKFGPEFVKELIKKKIDIFLDLKLYDIPNTMKETAAVITQMGCWAFTVHIKAGEEALGQVKDEVKRVARKLKIRRPLILGVTELTSRITSPEKILKLAEVAARAGLDGVVASAREAYPIKKKYNLKVFTPAIRLPEEKKTDQKRVATAKFAFAKGADYIVVGRPIIEKEDYLKAAEQILTT